MLIQILSDLHVEFDGNTIPPLAAVAELVILAGDLAPVHTHTRSGPVGLVHASPTERCWEAMLAKLVIGDSDTIWMALTSTARARNDARRAEQEGVPLDGEIDGVRAVLTGHAIVDEVTRTENVWHIDTGAGFRNGRLTLARIDTDPIETLTVGTAPAR